MQFVAAAVVTLPFVLVFESFRFDWTPQLVGASRPTRTVTSAMASKSWS